MSDKHKVAEAIGRWKPRKAWIVCVEVALLRRAPGLFEAAHGIMSWKMLYAGLIAIMPVSLSLHAQQLDFLSNDSNLAELKTSLQNALLRTGTPGAGIALVARDRTIWAGGIGKADLGAGKDVTADTIFRVGSISKSFIGMAILTLQEQGKLDLNAPVSEIAPEIEIENRWQQTSPVRIVNLLEHTAGFDDMHFGEIYAPGETADFSVGEVLQRFPGPQRVRWRPGTRMAYSNPGYALAGYIVGKAAAMPFEQYIYEAILQPLGMNTSDFRLTPLVQSLLAKGYTGRSNRPVPYRAIYLSPAGDLKSSPADMARFVRFLLNRGRLDKVRLLSPGSIVRAEAPESTLAARAGLKNGYGIGISTDLRHGHVLYGHDGDVDGFLSVFRYSPEVGLGYVVLMNGESDEAFDLIEAAVSQYLFRGILPQVPSIAVLNNLKVRQLTGFYDFANPRDQATAAWDRLNFEYVYERDGLLFTKRPLGKPERLIPVSDREFRRESEAGSSTIFLNDQQNHRVVQIDEDYYESVSRYVPLFRLSVLFLSLALMATAILFAPVWLIRIVRGRKVNHLTLRVLALATVLSFVVSVALPVTMDADVLGTRSVRTMAIAILTALFAMLSALSVVLAVRSLRQLTGVLGLYLMSVCSACATVALYLGRWHLLGFRTWNY
jgi:CubicO group peptidase (beta-lactamase class C family)